LKSLGFDAASYTKTIYTIRLGSITVSPTQPAEIAITDLAIGPHVETKRGNPHPQPQILGEHAKPCSVGKEAQAESAITSTITNTILVQLAWFAEHHQQ
jgi:hypothetical protein